MPLSTEGAVRRTKIKRLIPAMAYLSNNFKTNFYLYYILLKIVAKRIFD